AGTATFTVTLTGNVQDAFTVNYASSDGQAIAPGDYANATGSVIFPAGSPSGATRTFTVLIQNDNLVETGETFSATLTGITGLTTIGTASATTSIVDNDVAELSITDATMVEGDGGTTDMSFTVKLNNATSKPFKVGYTTADGTATTADNDYEPVLTGAALNYSGLANETQMLKVKIYGNKKIEADEIFKVILGAISETFDGRLTVNSTQGTATGTIVNDDSGEITISKVNGDEQETLPGSFIFSLPSGVTSGQPIVINYTLGGSAKHTAPDPDYTGTLTGTVTIAAGDERVILNLPVNDDEIVEDDEMVTIDASVSSINGGITLNASRPVVTIKDNDVAKLALSGPVTLLETNAGTTTATFTVTLDKRTTGSFDLKYATLDGTAKAVTNDYISNPGILHFAGNAGESYPITIQINGDKKIEPDEIFSLVLSDLSQTFNNRLTIPVTSTTVTIENDDSGTIVIVPADGSEDGTPGIRPASFTFRFSDPDVTTDVPVTINYGLSGTALSTGINYDYTASPATGTITLPANAKSVKLNLDVNDDQIVEGTETVILTTNTGGLPYGITVSNSPQSLNIADNDGAKLTISNGTVTEGDSGTQDITFNVKLDKATGVPFAVTYATADGTATDGEDYVGRTGVLNFNGTANEIQTITIQVKGDQRIEQDETFTVTLGTLSNLNDIFSIPSPEARGTIIDDDRTQIILSKVADGEEPLTNARFKVSIINTSVTSSEATLVSYTIAGTAINGVDYIALNGKVIIPAGSNEAFIDVEVIDDQLIEPTETVILSLTAASSVSFTLPVQTTPISASIKDNDQVALTVSNPVVTEGNNGTVTATFNVILSTGTPNGFTVSYNTTDGTATVADNDYTAVNGTLNFNGTAGETHAISVTVKGDQKIERDETFNMILNLSDTFGGRLNLIGSPAVGKILDDDNIPANKKITITTTDGMEGIYNGSYTFSFPTGITFDSPTTIPFILGGTAFKNQDYIAMFSSPIVIPAGVNSLKLPVPVIDDDIMEGAETLQMITAGVVNSRYNGITVNTPVPVLNILDNDYSQLTISSPTIKEGNSGGTLLTFEVKLNGATGAGFMVDYVTEDGTATLNDNDYNFVKGTLVFSGTAEGETKTISVWINGDINIEDDENFRVVLSGLSNTFGGALKISEWPGVGTILNDDIQPVASDDIIMTDEDTPVTFSVTGNDADVDGAVNPGSIKVVTSTVHGTLLFNPDGTFTYTPKDNYNGKDEFTYTVNDNTGIESNVAKVSIVINAVNDAPVARDDIFYVRKDGSLNATVKANDTDFDGDRLNFTVLTSPTNGKITSFNPADGSFVYVPDNGFVGIDHFSYRACDAPGLCSTAQVTLYVQPKVAVKLTPSVATITEGDLISITAEIGERLFQDVEITLNYTGSALLEKDYILEGDYISMVIPAGKLVTKQKFTISSIKDFLKEGEEAIQVRVLSATPSDFVDKGLGADILIKDFYPEDKGTDENANGDINPDPLSSPNGDGLGNENFIIHNIERYPDNEVLIFNRWGNKVFQVKGYNNRDKAFGGVANTGLLVNKSAVLADGVYFYIIHTKDSSGALRVNKGSVIIKR
ncbi:Calx-beta domain-containing protein, partial [Pedobacter hiemivivus]